MKLKNPIEQKIIDEVMWKVQLEIDSKLQGVIMDMHFRQEAALKTMSKDLENIKGYFKEILNKEQQTPQEALQTIQQAKEQEIKKLVNLADPTLEAGTLVHKAIEDYTNHQKIQRILTEELNIK